MPSAKDGDKCQGNNNKPAVVRGLGRIKEVAGSAYATMAVDCYGNICGWGDNTQDGGSTPVNDAITEQPGYESEKKVATGGIYGVVYKDLTAPPEGIPDTINQADPQESSATWKPIDGPGAPTGTSPGADNTAKVKGVASNEYGFAYMEEDGTVWTFGHNIFVGRGNGKHNGKTRGSWSEQNLNGWPVTDHDVYGKPGATETSVTLPPTQVSFAPGVFVKALWSGYEGFLRH